MPETTMPDNAAGLAFAFHYHRDKMNAATHASNPRFSPLTFMLARALMDAGVFTPELAEVDSHLGTYPLDGGR
jgi:hypothetical protein